jgi:hypothetical protein
MIKWKLKTILLVKKRLKFFILILKIIILDAYYSEMIEIKRKYPSLTIIKDAQIFVCEICKLVNPRKDFLVNTYILLGYPQSTASPVDRKSHNFVFVCSISMILVPIDASQENTSNDTKIEEI